MRTEEAAKLFYDTVVKKATKHDLTKLSSSIFRYMDTSKALKHII